MEQQNSIRDLDRQPRNGTVGHKPTTTSKQSHRRLGRRRRDRSACLGIGAPAIGGGALLPPVRRPWESGMSVESFTRGRSTAQPRTPRRPTRGSVEQPAMSYTIFFVFLNCEPFLLNKGSNGSSITKRFQRCMPFYNCKTIWKVITEDRENTIHEKFNCDCLA